MDENTVIGLRAGFKLYLSDLYTEPRTLLLEAEANKAELERLRAQVAELTYARDAYLASYRESEARLALMSNVVEAGKTILMRIDAGAKIESSDFTVFEFRQALAALETPKVPSPDPKEPK